MHRHHILFQLVVISFNFFVRGEREIMRLEAERVFLSANSRSAAEERKKMAEHAEVCNLILNQGIWFLSLFIFFAFSFVTVLG